MIIDRLYDRVNKVGPVCVGLDTDLTYIPNSIINKSNDLSDNIFDFNKRIIDATLDLTAVYKLQIAFYEAYGIKGLIAYKRTLEYIKDNSAISIADVKRGDISSTGDKYAKAHFDGDFEADFITVNPYMGYDTLTPFTNYLKTGDKGIFVLLRTSNPGAKDIEYLKSDNKPIYYHVGDKLNELGSAFKGSCGYSSIGAVVGGTHIDEAIEIRQKYPDMFFLIPGYGAQGATGKDVSLYFNNNNGAVVNSSRGIITAWKKQDDGESNFDQITRDVVVAMRKDIVNNG